MSSYPVATVLAGHVGGDINVGPLGGGTIGVDHAVVWASAVTVDLVDGHLDLAAGYNLRKLLASLSHDGLGTGLEVIGAGADGLANGVSSVTLEASAVLLEGVATGAVTGRRGVDAQSHAGAAIGGGGLDDGTVAGDQGDKSEECGGLHFVDVGGVMVVMVEA